MEERLNERETSVTRFRARSAWHSDWLEEDTRYRSAIKALCVEEPQRKRKEKENKRNSTRRKPDIVDVDVVFFRFLSFFQSLLSTRIDWSMLTCFFYFVRKLGSSEGKERWREEKGSIRHDRETAKSAGSVGELLINRDEVDDDSVGNDDVDESNAQTGESCWHCLVGIK